MCDQQNKEFLYHRPPEPATLVESKFASVARETWVALQLFNNKTFTRRGLGAPIVIQQ